MVICIIEEEYIYISAVLSAYTHTRSSRRELLIDIPLLSISDLSFSLSSVSISLFCTDSYVWAFSGSPLCCSKIMERKKQAYLFKINNKIT